MKLIVSGHGNFASGLVSAAQLIGGEQSALVAIDFVAGMSGEALRAELSKALSSEPTLICTDLLGGAPFREAVLLSQGRDDVVVIAGTTVQFLLEAMLTLDEAGENLRAWADGLLESAREGVTAYHQQPSRTQQSSDDGI
ncbi:MAG: PTS sugar transporter subunit IIA [Cardiobacteriaceae bacterium]|nr:PTS sugar transporter subunit IIA [Cardiobacteriaceae bacterium]